MLSGGGNRLDIRPLDQSGNLQTGIRGSHRGHAQSLNIQNPIPGYVYYWCRHPSRDRGGSQLQQFINYGYEVVPPDSQEHKGRETSLNYAELGLDNYQVHGDLVLLRITEERYREFCRWRDAQNDPDRDAATDAYLEAGRDLEERFGAGADGPLRYKGSGHGIITE
jgi:hypothetical protein